MTGSSKDVHGVRDAEQALMADLGWAVRSVSIAFQTLARDAVLDIPGGPRGYLVLVAVAQAEARSQLALGERLAIDKTQMTNVLDALESEGLVERVPDPADRRARLIRITRRGAKRLEGARASVRESEEYLLSALEPGDRLVLRDLLARVAAAASERVTPVPEYLHGDAPPRRGGRRS